MIKTYGAKVLCLLYFSLLWGKQPKAQEKVFRRDCNYISFYDPVTKVAEDWKEASNTFVFNINTNGDIRLHKPDGSVEVFRNMGGKEEVELADGSTCQVLKIMNEKGGMINIALYDSGLVILMYSDIWVKFSP